MMRTRSKLLLFLALMSISAVLGYVSWYLRSDSFLELVRSELISRVEGATGMSCTVERLRLNPFRGEFRLERVALNPRAGKAGPLSLNIDAISGRVGISSLRHFRFYLAELEIIHPRVVLASTASETGWDPREVLESLRLSLDVEAGKVLLRDGWVEFSDKRIPLNLSLEDVRCEISYVARPPSYKIRLAYRNGRLLWADRDITYDLDASVALSMAGIDVESFKFRHRKSLLAGDGWIREWKSPVLLLHASGTLDAEDLSLFSSDLREARGEIGVATNLKLNAAGLRFDGKFDLQRGGFRAATLSSLQGIFEIGNDVLLLKDVAGKLGDGVVRGEGAIQLREANRPPHRVSLSAEGVALREVGEILNLAELKLDNRADATAVAMWKHAASDLDLQVKAYLHAVSEPVQGKGTLLQGNVEFTYKRGAWYFAAADLSSPYTTIAVAGLGGSRFHLQSHTSRLSEPFAVLRGFVPSVDRLISRMPDLLQVTGSFGLDGDMRVEPSTTAYEGGIAIRGGQWRSYSVDSLTAKANWQDAHLELHSMKLQKGSESAEGDLTLEVPSDEGKAPGITFRGRVSQVSLESVKALGIEVSPDITGILSGSGFVSNASGTWSGEAQLLIEKGGYKDERFDSLRGRVRAQGEVLRIEECQIVRGEAKITARGLVRLDIRQIDVSLGLAGLSLAEIPALRKQKAEIEGRIAASGMLRGAMDSPAFSGSFELAGLRYSSWDLGGGKGTVELADGILQVSASAQSDLGKLEGRASISTEGDFPGKASFEFRDINLQRILSGEVPAPLSGLSTALYGSVELEGKFALPADLAASGEVDGARIMVHDYELHNEGKMRFAVAGRNLRIEKAKIVGDGTSLFVNGVLPLDRSPRLDLGLTGSLNLVFLERLEKKALITGSAELDVRAMGALWDPQVIGKAMLQNVRLEYGDLPVRLSAMKGTVIFSRNLVRFEEVQGSAGSGSIKLSGVLEHQSAQVRGINLQVAVQQLRLPYPKDFRSVVDADLVLRGNREAQVLTGDVNVLRSDYTRSINLLEQLANRSGAPPGPLTADPFLLGLRLDVDIHSDRGLNVDNELTRLRGGMRLTLRGTPAYPYLTGRVEAVEGSIFFRGNRFDIVHASADFLDRNRINPILDVRAEADVKTYRLVMDVSGDLDHLNINVTSDPPLSTVDIVSLLTTGKSLESGTESTRRQAEITGLSAASILSESLTGVIGKRLQRIFGLETFRIDPFLAGVANDPTARVTISERISKDLTVIFSRNLSTNEEQIVVVEYDVTRNLSIVASRDEQGKLGFDLRFRKRFR